MAYIVTTVVGVYPYTVEDQGFGGHSLWLLGMLFPSFMVFMQIWGGCKLFPVSFWSDLLGVKFEIVLLDTGK